MALIIPCAWRLDDGTIVFDPTYQWPPSLLIAMVGATSGVAGTKGAVIQPAAGDQLRALVGGGLYSTSLELAYVVLGDASKIAEFQGLNDHDWRLAFVADNSTGQVAKILVISESNAAHGDLGLEPKGRGRVGRKGDFLRQTIAPSRFWVADAFSPTFTSAGMPAPTIDTPGGALSNVNDLNGAHVVMTNAAAAVSTGVTVDVSDTGATATFHRAAGSWLADGHFAGGVCVITVGGGTLNAGNAGTFPIVSANANDLVVTFANPVAESGKTGTFTTTGSTCGLSSPLTATQRQIAPDIIFSFNTALIEGRAWFGLFDSDPAFADNTNLTGPNIKGAGFWWDAAVHGSGSAFWRAIQSGGGGNQTEAVTACPAGGNAHNVIRCRHLSGNNWEFSNLNTTTGYWENKLVQSSNSPGPTDNLRIYARLRNVVGSATRQMRVGLVDLFQT